MLQRNIDICPVVGGVLDQKKLVGGCCNIQNITRIFLSEITEWKIICNWITHMMN